MINPTLKAIFFGILSAIFTIFLWQTTPIIYHVSKITYKTGSLDTTDKILIYILGQLDVPKTP